MSGLGLVTNCTDLHEGVFEERGLGGRRMSGGGR